MYGTALAAGTREEALASYRRAVELAPGRLIHHVEAGRCLMELGRRQEARLAFEVGGGWAGRSGGERWWWAGRGGLGPGQRYAAVRCRCRRCSSLQHCRPRSCSTHPSARGRPACGRGGVPPPTRTIGPTTAAHRCAPLLLLQAAQACADEDINSWHTRMDAERFLAHLDRRPYRMPSLVPPHAQQQPAPAASVSTAAMLSGQVHDDILAEARGRVAHAQQQDSAAAA